MKTDDFYEQRSQFYLKDSATARGGVTFCFVVGGLAFGYGLYADPLRAWGSFLFNLFFFFSLSLGGVAFGSMQDVVGAQWGRPIKRLHEAFGSFLPIAGLLFVFMFVCIKFRLAEAGSIYKWIEDPKMLDYFWGKKTWLQEDAMLVRDIVALVLVIGLGLWHISQSLKPDLLFVNGEKDKSKAEASAAQQRLRFWSAPVLIVYALCFSLLAFDLTMSLAPVWFSTLWGGWGFAIMMQTLMASMLLFMFMLKESVIGQYVRRQQFHDIGKLMHGFTIFFAYLTYAHLLTYWYANMPETTEYYIARLHSPWIAMIVIVPILAFVLPLFALLPKVSKWVGGLAIPVASLILAAQWFTYLIVVMPEVVRGEWSPPLVLEFGVFLGFLGMFIGCLRWFGKRYPMLAVSDPLLAESLSHSGH